MPRAALTSATERDHLSRDDALAAAEEDALAHGHHERRGILTHMGTRDHPLAQQAQAIVAGIGLSFHVHGYGDAFSVDIVRGDGTVVYASGPDPLLAIVSAEQRYLAEECGGGTVRGATYLDKARERLRRWEESLPSAD
jgi:hypothetical protein